MSQKNHYDGGLKMKVVFEVLKGEKTASQIASHYRVLKCTPLSRPLRA